MFDPGFGVADILFGQDDPSKVDSANTIISLLGNIKHVRVTEDWVPHLKELVELGPSATLPICKAMEETDSALQTGVFAFALRAINDPRAIPTLIEIVPKTLLGGGSDMGVRLDDEELLKFMQLHDLDISERDDTFVLGRPCREVVGAIEAITNHEFDESMLVSIFLSEGPLQQYYQRKSYHDYAVFLKNWWLEHYAEIGADMGHVNVDLEPFNLEKPDAPIVFLNEPVVVENAVYNFVLGPPTREKTGANCFEDLDRGIRTRLGDSYEGAPDDLDEIEKWAEETNFDLMGIYTQVDGFDEPQYVLKALGMKFWQQDDELFSTLHKRFRPSELELGDARDGILIYVDPESGKYDPNRKATFLYQTAEGTCGAIQLIAQVTKKLG